MTKGIQINWKICDNAKECNGIAVCPTDVLSWDEENKKIKIDNSKCTCCGLCVDACEVDAIFLAKTDEEFEKTKKEIEDDPRKIADLFVDKYGATPIEPAFLIPEEKFELEVAQSNRLTIAELFNDDSIMCLRYSIIIKDLLEDFKETKFRKVELTTDNLLKKYDIKELPALIFFKDGKLLGKIEGYYEVKDKETLVNKIKDIIK